MDHDTLWLNPFEQWTLGCVTLTPGDKVYLLGSPLSGPKAWIFGTIEKDEHDWYFLWPHMTKGHPGMQIKLTEGMHMRFHPPTLNGKPHN